MEQFKRVKVVMLPTNEKAGLGSIYKRIKDDEIGLIDDFDKIGNLYINKNPNVQSSNSNFEAQHLYIISNDEIKEGDWYIWMDNKTICKAEGMLMTINNHLKNGHVKKIIATTDDSLGFSFKVNYGASTTTTFTSLPQPSQQFIKKYVESYNKGEIITNVLVEYEEWCNCNGSIKMRKHLRTTKCDKCIEWEELKINPKDNTITIKKVKDSWNREEVIILLEKALAESKEQYSLLDRVGINKWIEENL